MIIKAYPSGNSVGGTAWYFEFNRQYIIYAIDLNDKETPISIPLNFSQFRGANLMITNGYIQPIQHGLVANKIYNYVNEEKLRKRLEDVMVGLSGHVLIPITCKNRILHMLMLLEQIFDKSQKLQSQSVRATTEERPVIYLEHMSKDTIDVAKSHRNWMNFKGNF